MSDSRFPIIDKYRLKAEIGSGGFSKVYRATHEYTKDTHAIKVISSDLGEKALEVFEREARILVELKGQANIVRVTDAGRTANDHSLYLVMDYYKTSFDRVEDLTVEQVFDVGRKVSKALAVVHDQGIVHKDVKPSNIFADAQLEPALGDFGISTDGSIDRALTIQAFSIYYAAPEVFLGGKAEAPRDVYALGATLYSFLEGDTPLGKLVTPGENKESMAVRIFDEEPDPFRNPNVPPELGALLLRCLAKDPGDRPTADELAGELTTLESQYHRSMSTAPASLTGNLMPPAAEAPYTNLQRGPAGDVWPDPVRLDMVAQPRGRMPKDRTDFRHYEGLQPPPLVDDRPPEHDEEHQATPGPGILPIRRLVPLGAVLGALALLLGIGVWQLPSSSDQAGDEGSPLASAETDQTGDQSVEVLLPPDDVQVVSTGDGGFELTWTSRLEPPEGFWVSLADSDIGEAAASPPHVWTTAIPDGASPCFEVFAVGELGMSYPSSPIRCASS